MEQSERRIPIKFLYAVPLRDVTVTHMGDSIRIDYAAGAHGDLLLRSNLEGDFPLPVGRLASICFEFEHVGQAPLEVRLRARGSGWLGSHTELWQTATLPVSPREMLVFDTREFRICQNEPDADHLRIDWETEAPGTLVLRAVTYREQSCEEYFAPRVDRYGQRIAGEWLGKVRNDAELRADGGLPLPEPMGGRDAYGGWTGGPRFAATGFFRVEQDGDTWWLVTPEGHPYLSYGPTCVGVGMANTSVAGRQELFEELPPQDGQFRDAWSGVGDELFVDAQLFPSRAFRVSGPTVCSFYIANLQRKYGEGWRERWSEVTAARLRHWGMNTLACWSDIEFAHRARIPYLIPANMNAPLDFAGLPTTGEAPFPLRQTPDVFHPDFAQRVAEGFSQLATFKDDPYLLGYFVQNEEQWCGWQSPFSLPANWESRRAFVTGLYAKYGSIKRLNAAWGTRFQDFAHLQTFRHADNPPGISPQGIADCDDFLRRFAEQYFSSIRARLKEVDPNHMFWGCRFLALPPRQAILDGIAPHTDIVSVNWYIFHWQSIADIPAFLGDWHRAVRRPLVLSEYCFELTDARLLAGRWLRPDPEERARLAREFTESCLALPFVVGCHWFQYTDEAITGRSDGERTGLGIVDVADRPYPELDKALRAVGENMYREHGKC